MRENLTTKDLGGRAERIGLAGGCHPMNEEVFDVVIRIRTRNHLIKKLFDNADNKTKTIEEILDKYTTGQLIDKDSIPPQVITTKTEKENWQLRRLKAQTLREEFELKLSLMRNGKYSPNDVVEILNGKKQIEAVSEKDSSFKQEICDLCGHKHTTTEPRVCTVGSCYCGVR